MHPLAEALAGRRAIEREIEVLMKRHFPPGAAISWKAQAGRTYSGSVVRNCYGDRIEVLNAETQRNRFIRAYQIVVPEGD